MASNSTITKRMPSFEEKLKSQISDGIHIGTEAALSKGWIYPLKGVLYFITHPVIVYSIRKTLIQAFLLSTVTVFFIFLFFYAPTVAVLAFATGPAAFFGAIPVLLGASTVTIKFLSKFLDMQPALDILFDEVLVQRGHISLVSLAREVTPSENSKKSKGLGVTIGKTIMKPLNRFSTEGLLRYLVSLPLNSVPIVGTVVFLIWNGVKAGPSLQSRYFYLLSLLPSTSSPPPPTRETVLSTHRGVYTSMGACSLALQLIPFVSMLFNFTSVCGAALFACDLEDERTGKKEEIEVVTVQAENGEEKLDTDGAGMVTDGEALDNAGESKKDK